MTLADNLSISQVELSQIFWEIDLQVKANLSRVLASMRKHRVGSHHFASVSGYGHNDLGRDTLDQVFADVMQAEAAAVRVQLVSGTHAIACALYGILRPGDELLAVDAMNDPRGYMVGKRLIEAGKSPAADLIADPATELKTLLRA